jgi:hypothetical protein
MGKPKAINKSFCELTNERLVVVKKCLIEKKE